MPRSKRLGDRAIGVFAGEHELRDVQHLHGELAANLHLADVERRVDAGPAAGRPVAHAVGAVLLQQAERRDDVALRLRHLLAVRIEHEAGDRRVGPRHRVVLEVRAHHRREQPGADDVVRLRPQVHRERPLEQVLVGFPPGHELRRHRRRGPGVHDVGVADESTGLAALGGRESLGHVGRRIDRKTRLIRDDRMGIVRRSIRAQRVPHRKRHAEEALPADAPVAVEAVDPVFVTAPACTRGARRFRWPRLMNASRWSMVLMNHWRLVTISRGRSPFS